MKISIYAIANSKPHFADSGIIEYAKRLNHYCNFEIKLFENKNTKQTNDLNEHKLLETNLLLSKLPTKDFTLVVLDERGIAFNSIAFSQKIEQWQLLGTKHLIFAIGGSYGFDLAFIKSNYSIKLSDMVIPHHLVRLFLAEQLYRSFTILKNENYHH
jgi:23S rRNA (pseudouridine1915-N3)-methyltransferase